jgi:hypothetical protein
MVPFWGNLFSFSLEIEERISLPKAFKKVTAKIKVNPISRLSTGKYLSQRSIYPVK